MKVKLWLKCQYAGIWGKATQRAGPSRYIGDNNRRYTKGKSFLVAWREEQWSHHAARAGASVRHPYSDEPWRSAVASLAGLHVSPVFVHSNCHSRRAPSMVIKSD